MNTKTIEIHAIAEAILEELVTEGLTVSLNVSRENNKPIYTLKFSLPDEPQPNSTPKPHLTTVSIPTINIITNNTSNIVSKLTTNTTSLSNTAINNALYTNLCKLRLLLAKEEKVSCFVIAHNQLLEAIANTKPNTIEELEAIKGIGPHKLSKYGHSILAVLNGTSPEDAFQNRITTVSENQDTTETSSYESASESHKEPKQEKQDTKHKKNSKTTAELLEVWKPSLPLLYYYKNRPNATVSPGSRFGRWCKTKGYDPKDVISGKINI